MRQTIKQTHDNTNVYKQMKIFNYILGGLYFELYFGYEVVFDYNNIQNDSSYKVIYNFIFCWY